MHKLQPGGSLRYPEQNSFIVTKLLRIYKPYLSWEKSVGAEAVARDFPRSAAGPAEKCVGKEVEQLQSEVEKVVVEAIFLNER